MHVWDKKLTLPLVSKRSYPFNSRHCPSPEPTFYHVRRPQRTHKRGVMAHQICRCDGPESLVPVVDEAEVDHVLPILVVGVQVSFLETFTVPNQRRRAGVFRHRSAILPLKLVEERLVLDVVS